MKDVAEVRRIAELTPGRERARAASRLLERPRNGLDWYVIFSSSVGVMLDVPWDERWEERLDYADELRTALCQALGTITPEEANVLRRRIGALDPGPVRRQHVEVLLRAGVGPDAYELVKECHDDAEDLRERLTTARAMLKAKPEAAIPVLLRELRAEEPELAFGLLRALDRAAREVKVLADRFLDETARLGADFLDRPRTTEIDNLGNEICATLARGRREKDRARLLAFARSRHACRAQALVYLKEWTGKNWEADDERWDRLLAGEAGD